MTFSRKHRPGFTLIEVVAVLVVIAIALGFGSMMFVTTTGNYVATSDAVEDGQKVQAAMNRLVKELTYAETGFEIRRGRNIRWTSAHPERAGEAGRATWNGNSGSNLLLNGKILLDNVDLFQVSSTGGAISLTVRCANSIGVSHTAVVHPRSSN